MPVPRAPVPQSQRARGSHRRSPPFGRRRRHATAPEAELTSRPINKAGTIQRGVVGNAPPPRGRGLPRGGERTPFRPLDTSPRSGGGGTGGRSGGVERDRGSAAAERDVWSRAEP